MLPSGRAFYCMARGWMKNPVFADQPLTEREAWLWLIEAAAYQPEARTIAGHSLSLSRGETVASAGYLATAWGWERTTAWRFLGRLEKQGMISRRSATAGATALTIVTICNYSAYQLMPGVGATASATPLQQLVQQPVQQPRATAGSGASAEQHGEIPDTLPDAATAPCNSECNSECNEKANKACNEKAALPEAAAGGLAQAMVSAFVVARNETFGNVANDRGTRLDFIEANRLIAAGLDLEAFQAVLSEQLPRLKTRGVARPRSLKILSGDFDARLAAASRRQAERVTDPERDSWLPKITHFKSTGQWLANWGGAPGAPGCEMPQRLQDECLAARKAAA